MKSKFFVIGVVIACLAIAFIIYYTVFGHPSHFMDAAKKEPKPGDLIGSVYTGGPLVAILLGLTLMVIITLQPSGVWPWLARKLGLDRPRP